MLFINTYDDINYADSYSKLEFPGCYYLAYRDLPDIISTHARKGKAIDFGCGTGRSTRFLRRLGFDVIGIDISESMINKACELDRDGKYQLIKDGDFSSLPQNEFDLVLSLFTFDNIPGEKWRIKLFEGLKNLLNNNGIIVCLDSTPELYVNEWVSFSTKDFPENWKAKSGDIVRDVIIDAGDPRPCEDILWTDNDYKKCFENAGLDLIKTYKPLAKQTEPFNWVIETKIAPWVIYVLRKKKKYKDSYYETMTKIYESIL